MWGGVSMPTDSTFFFGKLPLGGCKNFNDIFNLKFPLLKWKRWTLQWYEMLLVVDYTVHQSLVFSEGVISGHRYMGSNHSRQSGHSIKWREEDLSLQCIAVMFGRCRHESNTLFLFTKNMHTRAVDKRRLYVSWRDFLDYFKHQ